MTQLAAIELTGRSATMAGSAVEIMVISKAAQKAIRRSAVKVIQKRKSFFTLGPCSSSILLWCTSSVRGIASYCSAAESMLSGGEPACGSGVWIEEAAEWNFSVILDGLPGGDRRDELEKDGRRRFLHLAPGSIVLPHG